METILIDIMSQEYETSPIVHSPKHLKKTSSFHSISDAIFQKFQLWGMNLLKETSDGRKKGCMRGIGGKF